MKQKDIFRLAAYQGIDPLIHDQLEIEQFEVKDDDLTKVLNEIFSVDERTGMPKGDIAYWLSKDGNPMVKNWIETNLLAPRARLTGSSIEGVTDDMIAEFSRQDGESVSAYQKRLTGLFDSAKEEYERLINNQD